MVDKNYSYQIEVVRRQYSGNAHGVIKGIGVVTQSGCHLRESHAARNPNEYAPELSGLSQYAIALLLHPNPQTYLIVGAGAGNDAAGGLRHGVGEIRAVEIDPAIVSLGRSYHPERPYASPAVQLVNDDARSLWPTVSPPPYRGRL